MKKALLPILLLQFVGGLVFAQSPTSSQNYIVETTVKVPGITNVSQIVPLNVDQANRTISYFDGLGRPLQTVQWQGSPLKKDIVQFMLYDALGREAFKYLPYAEQTANDGGYKSSAPSTQLSFYSGGSWDANIVRTAQPYSQVIFEPSPLNRVVEQGAPGGTWQPYNAAITNSGHTQIIVPMWLTKYYYGN